MRRIVIIIALCVLTFPAQSTAGRSITLPFTESFDSDNYSDLIWINHDATFTHATSGCWSGSCAKFTPCSDMLGGGTSGLGQFTGFTTSELHIRFLIKIGPTWFSTATDVGEGLGDKLIITNQSGGDRSITGLLADTHTTPNTFSLCQGTDIAYNCECGRDGDPECYWPNGSDEFHIGGDIADDYDNQWVCLELKTVSGGLSVIYLWTQDGVHNGTAYVSSRTASAADPWTYIDKIGGYYNQNHTVDAGTYMMFDELVISSTSIGPPAGFVSASGSTSIGSGTGSTTIGGGTGSTTIN